MLNSLVSYQFDEDPVRVVKIAGDPWFVANDVAKVLGYRNAPDMTRNLDEDEKGTHIMRTLGGNQEMTVVSESGLYAVILKSRREEAVRFRKWVTGEVLPELRRTGKYQLHDHEPPPETPLDHDPARLTAFVGVVREARRLFGPSAARNVWSQLGLPLSIADAAITHDGDPMMEPLQAWLADKAECTIAEAAAGMGIHGEIEFSTRRRIGALLSLLGWRNRTVRRGHGTVKLWLPTRPLDLEGGDHDA